MKIGIISDVHSNILALEEVFKKFEEINIEKIICIGDVIGIGPYSEKCIQFLMDRDEKILSFVRGNHENYLLKGLPKTSHNEKNGRILTEEDIKTHKWNHNRLSVEQMNYIRNLKNRDVLDIDGIKIVVEHYPMDKNEKFKKYFRQPTVEELTDIFDVKDAAVYLFGHTHQGLYYEKHGQHYINPGSLGCPINTKCASAGLLEIDKDKINYEPIEVNYDVDAVIKDIKELNYPLNHFMIRTFYKS